MIAFACAHCGMKFQVKPEFAGRSTRCPTCKHPLVVPPEDTLSTTPSLATLDGLPSSLARAGIFGDVTLATPKSAGGTDAPPLSAAIQRLREILVRTPGFGEW